MPLIPRLHLLEIHDQSWCPVGVRDAITDLLQWTLTTVHHYAPVAPVLARALRRTGADTVVDLGSGGGGPWARVLPDLVRHGVAPRLVLTDKYPNRRALARTAARLGPDTRVEPEPVDARAVPGQLDGFRTLFTTFHHFTPADARAVLADAARGGRGIAVFEVTRRSPLTLVLMLGFVLSVFVVPFLRPFRWDRLFWSWLVPVVPLVAVWDGVVSCLRTYSPGELRALVAGWPQYDWEIGLVPHHVLPMWITYLIGTPRLSDRSAGG